MKKFIILFLLCSSAAYGQVVVDDANKHIFFGDRVQFYEDSENLTFAKLLHKSPSWKQSSLLYHNFALKETPVWVRFDLDNRTGSDLYLTFNTLNLDSISVYLVDHKGKYMEKTGGHIYPFSHREVYDKDIFFIVPQSANIKTVYARFSSTYMILFMPEILTIDKVSERSIRYYLPYAFYYGLLFALVFYGFFIFISTRGKAYLKLVMLLYALALYDLSHDGFSFMYLWPEWTYVEYIIVPLTVSLIGIAEAFFLKDIFEIKKNNYTVINRFYNCLITTSFIMAVFSFIFGKKIMPLVFLLILQATLTILLSVSYIAFVKRNRSAILIFIAFFYMNLGYTLAIIGNIPFFLRHLPLLNNYFDVLFFMKSGTALLCVTYTFTIADKINIMKKDLEISEETYRSIFNGTQETIALLDVEDFRVIDGNKAMLKMFDMKYDEIIGKTVEYFSSVDNGFTNKRAYRKYREMCEGFFQPFEWLYRKKNGDTFWCEVTINNVIISGEKRLMIVLRDISDRKRSEEEREKRVFPDCWERRSENVIA